MYSKYIFKLDGMSYEVNFHADINKNLVFHIFFFYYYQNIFQIHILLYIFIVMDFKI